ncbi:hypothetical protein PR048_000055 [Dryococelus australis]|uniref:Uncharacterized protein n=1 Tax=Dryococelus australis TaxID=614101 RepID=A0ABQ9IDJ8_9NEOP|nr:hypothetical protein PR048_000055 [Dryococelus australis]
MDPGSNQVQISKSFQTLNIKWRLVHNATLDTTRTVINKLRILIDVTSWHSYRSYTLAARRLFFFFKGAAVAERLARSPPTKANPGSIPGRSPDSPKWESCRTMPLVDGFSRESPVSPPLFNSGTAPYSFNHPHRLSRHRLRVIEVSMEKRRNKRAGETGYPQGKKPADQRHRPALLLGLTRPYSCINKITQCYVALVHTASVGRFTRTREEKDSSYMIVATAIPSNRRLAAGEVTSGREVCDCEYQTVKCAAGRLAYWTRCCMIPSPVFTTCHVGPRERSRVAPRGPLWTEHDVTWDRKCPLTPSPAGQPLFPAVMSKSCTLSAIKGERFDDPEVISISSDIPNSSMSLTQFLEDSSPRVFIDEPSGFPKATVSPRDEYSERALDWDSDSDIEDWPYSRLSGVSSNRKAVCSTSHAEKPRGLGGKIGAPRYLCYVIAHAAWGTSLASYLPEEGVHLGTTRRSPSYVLLRGPIHQQHPHPQPLPRPTTASSDWPGTGRVFHSPAAPHRNNEHLLAIWRRLTCHAKLK